MARMFLDVIVPSVPPEGEAVCVLPLIESHWLREDGGEANVASLPVLAYVMWMKV